MSGTNNISLLISELGIWKITFSVILSIFVTDCFNQRFLSENILKVISFLKILINIVLIHLMYIFARDIRGKSTKHFSSSDRHYLPFYIYLFTNYCKHKFIHLKQFLTF